jgi:hypothetical protein
MSHEDGPSEPRKRAKPGEKKESFPCTFPGCGQVRDPLLRANPSQNITDTFQTYSRMEYLKRHQRKRKSGLVNGKDRILIY